MQRFNLFVFALAAVVVAANTESICQRLAAGSGSQKAFMQQFMGLSFASITNDDKLAPFFNGAAHDRNGHNVTNYISNNTLYQQLIDSHVKYFGKLFNCTDSSIPQYSGPSMEAAHAKLEISASLFEQYQLLSLDLLPIAALGKVTTEVEIQVSELFEQHRGVVAEDQICNEEDCKLAILTLDGWDNLYPMFLNMEHGQNLTISNTNTVATNFTLLNITDGLCSQMGSIIYVGAGFSVTTAAIGELPAGEYYFGKWPTSCALQSATISPMISQIRVHAPVVAPVEAPVQPPVEPPVQPPVEPPVPEPVTPVQPPVKSPQQAPAAPVSPPVETPTASPSGSSPVSNPAAEPIASPESHENNERDLTPVVIILSIAVAVLLGVVVFLVFKLKKKEPHYEIIND